MFIYSNALTHLKFVFFSGYDLNKKCNLIALIFLSRFLNFYGFKIRLLIVYLYYFVEFNPESIDPQTI